MALKEGSTVHVAMYARAFVRPTLADTLEAIAAHGISAVQFNLECAGLDPLPAELPRTRAVAIREALQARGMTMAAVSGTYNMIDPDPARRAEGLGRLRTLIDACADLGTSVITLCTGTRDPLSMWRPHPDNGSEAAWRDLVQALAGVLPAAEARGVTLAFEPEVSNVIDSTTRARRLLDELRSPALRVCIDGANLFHAGELPRMGEILDQAFDLLGGDIVLAHAKDLDRDGAAGDLPAGHGRLDYPRYLSLLRRCGYGGAVVLHGLKETEVDGCAAFIRSGIAAVSG